MSEPVDMILPLLREMRAENVNLHKQTKEQVVKLEKRIEKIENTLGSFRQSLTADTLMSKLITGEFEERIEALEQKVRELEKVR